jgi:hypothetical protein
MFMWEFQQSRIIWIIKRRSSCQNSGDERLNVCLSPRFCFTLWSKVSSGTSWMATKMRQHTVCLFCKFHYRSSVCWFLLIRVFFYGLSNTAETGEVRNEDFGVNARRGRHRNIATATASGGEMVLTSAETWVAPASLRRKICSAISWSHDRSQVYSHHHEGTIKYLSFD